MAILTSAIVHAVVADPTTTDPSTALDLPVSSPAPEPEFAIPSTLDRAGRIIATVTVNGLGPFRFILDTGANRSAVSRRLAAAHGWVPSDSEGVRIHGVTGSAVVPAVQIHRIETGKVELVRDRRLPVIDDHMLAGADGILGIDGLAGTLVDIDLEADRVTIRRTMRPAPRACNLAIPVSLRHRGLLLAEARVGRVRVKAIIDSGAEHSLGNLALREAIYRSREPSRDRGDTQVYGATPAVDSGESLLAPTIVVGELEIRNLQVTFADLHVFRIWDLQDEPALLIGMDLLGLARRIVIDYRRRELCLALHPRDRMFP